jgi:NADH-quinone oxidoreductase subunit M
MLYERRHTYEIAEYGGIWRSAPRLTAMFAIAMFAGIGLPGFSGFIGEFLSLLGTFVADRPWAIVGALGVILAAVYMLWSFQRAFMGTPQGENRTLRDANFREVAVVVPLLALSLFLGIYPKPVLDRIEPTVKRTIIGLELKTDGDFKEEQPAGFDDTELPGVTKQEILQLEREAEETTQTPGRMAGRPEQSRPGEVTGS